MNIGDLVGEIDERRPSNDAIVFSVSEKYGIIPQTQLFKKSIATDDRSKYKKIRYGDIIYNPFLLWNRAVGVCFDERGGCVSPSYIVLRPRAANIERFLHYFFRSDIFTATVDAIATGSVTRRRTMPLSAILKLVFNLPDPVSQKAANSILVALDDKIELNRRMNETLEAIAQALWQKMFVEDADPNWRKVKLRTLCEKITKGTTPTTLKKSFVDTGINFVKAESIDNNGNFIYEKFAHIDEETNKLLSRSILRENDILYTIAGTIGRTAVVTREILPANTNQAIAIIRLNNSDLFISYIRLLMKASSITTSLGVKVVHAVQANLSLSVISETEVLIPEEQNLREFNEKSNPVFIKIRQNCIQIRTLSTLRDTLLPKLISGELRIKDAERFVKEKI